MERLDIVGTENGSCKLIAVVTGSASFNVRWLSWRVVRFSAQNRLNYPCSMLCCMGN